MPTASAVILEQPTAEERCHGGKARRRILHNTPQWACLLACAAMAACLDTPECPADSSTQALNDARAQLEEAQKSIANLNATVAELRTSADGMWTTAQSSLAAAPSSPETVQWLEKFLRDHPTDPRAALARKQLAQATQAEQALHEADRLNGVRMADIAAEPRDYRHKLFKRRMCCNAPYDSSVRCYLKFRGDGTVDITTEDVQLQLKPGQGKRVLAMRSVGECKHLLEATMLFTGQVAYGTPYMIARDLQPL